MTVKGFLGKAFSLAAVAALSLPLIAAGQSFGIVPGDLYAASYRDVAQEQLSDYIPAPIAALYKSKDTYTGPILAPKAETFSEAVISNYNWREDTITDTNVGGMEGLVGYGLSAVFGSAGIAMAAWNDKKGKRDNVIEDDKDFLGMWMGTAFGVGAASSATTISGAVTHNTAVSTAGAGMALAAFGMVAAIPPLLAARSVWYNFNSGYDKVDVNAKIRGPILSA